MCVQTCVSAQARCSLAPCSAAHVVQSGRGSATKMQLLCHAALLNSQTFDSAASGMSQLLEFLIVVATA